jgi:hypothetical protein
MRVRNEDGEQRPALSPDRVAQLARGGCQELRVDEHEATFALDHE